MFHCKNYEFPPMFPPIKCVANFFYWKYEDCLLINEATDSLWLYEVTALTKFIQLHIIYTSGSKFNMPIVNTKFISISNASKLNTKMHDDSSSQNKSPKYNFHDLYYFRRNTKLSMSHQWKFIAKFVSKNGAFYKILIMYFDISHKIDVVSAAYWVCSLIVLKKSNSLRQACRQVFLMFSCPLRYVFFLIRKKKRLGATKRHFRVGVDSSIFVNFSSLTINVPNLEQLLLLFNRTLIHSFSVCLSASLAKSRHFAIATALDWVSYEQ